VRQLAPSCNRRDLSRLLQLVELAYGYQPTASLRATDFVNYVSTERVSDPTADPVRVMTVHQAKGLEFDIVVLPELEASLTGQTASFVAGAPAPTKPIDRVCRYRNSDIQKLLPSEWQKVFIEATRREVTETLCELYVSVTRPIHALHMIIPPDAGKEKKTLGGLLCAALANGGPREPEKILYKHGDPQWYLQVPADGSSRILAGSAAGESRPLEIRLAPMPDGRRRGLERAAPSGLEGGPKVKLAHVLRTGNKAFEQIDWLDDGVPQEATLLRVANELGASGLDVDQVLEQFYHMLRTPQIKAILSRGSYQPPTALPFEPHIAAELAAAPLRLEVCNERRFAVRQQNRILSGSIDRLTLMYDGQRLVAADILDYKTDAVASEPIKNDSQSKGKRRAALPEGIESNPPVLEADALAAKVEFYRGQLEAYRPAVATLYGLSSDRISARLLMLGPGVVCDVKQPRTKQRKESVPK
jgi:ATP-dependent exoDNAse (exonuclease V) beta subunit